MDIQRFLKKKIHSRADKLDDSWRLVRKKLRQCGKKKLLGAKAPHEFGGLELYPREYFSFIESTQSYSAAFGFLQRQHQAAVRLMTQSHSDQFKQEWLPNMVKGKPTSGVCIFHLRHPSQQSIVGRAHEGGWLLTGEASWVSGFRIFDYLVVGFFMPKEREEGMALIPFKKSKTLKVSKPIETIALKSVQTVHLSFQGHHVPEDHVFFVQPIGSYKEGPSLERVHFVNFSGIALGFKRELAEYKDKPQGFYDALCQRYEICREAFLNKEPHEECSLLYAQMHRIATDFCTLARLTQKKSALFCPNAIERRYRELMLFGVIVNDRKTIETSLHALLHS